MRIKIIQLGKSKEKEMNTLISDYLKKLKSYAFVDIVELNDTIPSKSFSRDQALEEDAEKILKCIRPDDFLVALDENGQELGSLDFSSLLQEFKDNGQTITFVIGSAFGLHQSIKTRANLSLSLSKMTFTHQMVRLFLLEQIFRGICIMIGKEYHI